MEIKLKNIKGVAMRDLKTKLSALIIIVVLIATLGGCEPPQQFERLERPIIIVAKSKDGDVVVRDKTGKYLTLSRQYYLANSLYDTYAVGDTVR
jgi:hypothetical protein